MNGGGPQLKQSLTDFHFSQLFFTLGHLCVKILSYLDDQEDEAKKFIGNGG